MIHRNGKKFFNPWRDARPHGLLGVLRWSLGRVGRQRVVDAGPEPWPRTEPIRKRLTSDELQVTWIGHSSFLVQAGSVNLLTDPIWSLRASPLQLAGPKRISPPGILFDSLPPIDAVLLSHDHYDHLDRSTVLRLSRSYPDAEWLVPLGVKRWLTSQAVRNIHEMDWGESVEFLDTRFTAVPAQHFSGRSVFGRNTTLWCGWIIRTGRSCTFFAGDTGLHPEFESVARSLGPFDIAILPVGAYEPRWFMRPVHMNPEDAVAAYRKMSVVNASHRCVLIPGHWGTFVLTDEPTSEPPVRLRKAWAEAGLPAENCALLRPGQTFSYIR